MKEINRGIADNGGFVNQEEKNFTIFETSLLYANDGFTVYDCSNGELVLRVDSCELDARDRDELVLMGPHDRCLITFRKKVYENPREEYEIEGSCWSRSCTVIDAARRAVVRRSGRRLTRRRTWCWGRTCYR
ncbi:unnamed protein product [Linum tenue]|uniref:Uncharacterized protein n=1 Tax=Linum tenue TaxID=586396 RepID=A0AAV0LEQ0_9ROSI|nr:unnamed protein product [Linum tenue]